MIVKHPFKNGKRSWAVGDKYAGGLSESEFESAKNAGCFEPTHLNQDESIQDLSIEEISELSIAKLKLAAEDLTDEEINKLIELEEAKEDKKRLRVIKHLTNRLS